MDAKLIDGIGHRYYKLSLWVIVGLSLLALLLIGCSPYWGSDVLNAILISAAFSFLTSIAYEAAWKGIAKNSPSTLTKFYLAAPALRMMAAVLVILVYYVINRHAVQGDGTSAIRRMMLVFTSIFLTYYISMLVLDCVYFAQVEKRNKLH
ncbi:MAG: hypothetical protein J5867_02815 [Prevotella sp.]|nr:hypothetical protein [Prevotella sp.]